ncbi:MAG: helix-turn-helix domain-containing protein [Pseudomonadales bacterium]
MSTLKPPQKTATDFTVYAAPVNRVLQAAEQFGASRARLLSKTGIDAAGLRLPDSRFHLSQLLDLYQLADESTSNPDMGLTVGRITFLTGLSLQLYMGTVCQSFRDYLNLMPSILRINGDVGEVLIRPAGDFIRLEWTPTVVQSGLQRYLSDEYLTASAAIVDSLCILPVPVRKAHFSYPEPVDTTALREVFGDQLVFEQEISCLYFDRKVLNYPLIPQDHSLNSELGNHFSHLFDNASQQDPFSTALRQSIARLLAQGDTSIDSVANRLNVSRRTLQRRLADRDTSFMQVLQEVRVELARRYLADQRLAITEIAYLLAYADQGSFSSAFKTWYGKTPSEYRQG